ncbi:hypothetical protein B0H13DRAFT_1661437 [Mycena leptocephala]|nr:hypothetical protein B0H13DRAFT_1661437 [Mycena leptocephala]
MEPPPSSAPPAQPEAPPPPSTLTAPQPGRPKPKPKAKVGDGAVAPQRVDVTVPGDAPSWLADSVAWLQRMDLGCHYTALLAALVRLEGAFGYDQATYGTLPSEGRPVQVHDWIRAGRARTKKIPLVIDVERYADEWYGWWDSMQPEWRTRGQDKKWRVGGDTKYGGPEEWGVLDRPGPNGCLSVVASLYFWGVCKDQPIAVQERWREAVEDVSWMLEGLEASMK